MNNLEKQMAQHLETFPERRKELLDFQSSTKKDLGEIKDTIKNGLLHPKASAQTIAMYGDLRDKVEKMEHVFFGDEQTKEIGMVKKVDEMYTILVQAKGAQGILKIVTLIGATLTSIVAIKVFWNKL